MKARATALLFWGVILFLYLPMAVLVVYSFNDSRFGIDWRGFTLRWYGVLFTDAEVGAALKNTAVVSLCATAVSTLLGTLLGIGLHLGRFRGRRLVEALFYIPVIIPDIIMGIALLAFYVAVHLTLGRVSIILAHVAFQISFVALVVRSRMQEFPVSLIEAARDLGASQLQTLWRVLFPLLRPAVVAGALLAFALSVDDFVITYFTAGPGSSTLPVRIYSMVKRGVTPDVNALSTLTLAVTFIAIYLGLRILHRPSRAGS